MKKLVALVVLVAAALTAKADYWMIWYDSLTAA